MHIEYHIYKQNPNGIMFSSDKWGYFAIVERQPFENINITTKGGLINAKVHPMVSLRIPKNSVPIEVVCFLQVDIRSCFGHDLVFNLVFKK